MPAFSITTSSLSNFCALDANALTESYDTRSSSHISTVSEEQFVDATMDSFAASAFGIDRQARITLAALSFTNHFAVSNPRPVFAPVTMTVLPSKLCVGTGTVKIFWL